MADEERIVRLTKLARRVWRGAVISAECDGISVITGIKRDGERTWTEEPVFVRHARALDALEAALLVLAGDLVLTGEERSLMRPDIAKVIQANVDVGMAYTTLLCAVEQIASEWDERSSRMGAWNTERALLEQCAAELRARAKGEKP